MKELRLNVLSDDIYHVYVDGSWKKGKPEIAGWAFIVLDSKFNIFKEQSGVIECVSRQVDGELYATLKSLEYISKLKSVCKIKLYYDYAGIEAWANGSWKAKSEIALEYVKRLEKYKTLLERVTFVKIKSHAGLDKWNDRVDLLAKSEVDKY
jgi:ribonuclease HI